MVKPKNKSRRRLGARCYKNYTDDMLDLAVEYVKNKKMTSREAEKHFGIPRRTLLNKVKNLHQKKIGPPTRLTEEEEKNIVKVVVAAGDFGCRSSKLDLRIIVYEYLKKNGREAVFHGKLPGNQWITSFMERNASELTVRSCQNIKKARAEKSVEDFLDYFKNVEETVKDIPLSNILNLDETNLSDDSGSSKCIFRREVKYPERTSNICIWSFIKVPVEEKKEKNNSLQKQSHTNGSLAPQIVYLECAEISNESEILTSDIEVKEENMEFSHDFENEILTDEQWSRNSELETDEGQIDVNVEHTESSHDSSGHQILLRQDKESDKISLVEKSHDCNCKNQSSDSNHDYKMVQELKTEFAIATEKYKKEIERLKRKLKSLKKVCDRRLTIISLHNRIERLEQQNVSLYQLLTKRFENER